MTGSRQEMTEWQHKQPIPVGSCSFEFHCFLTEPQDSSVYSLPKDTVEECFIDNSIYLPHTLLMSAYDVKQE